MGLAEPRITVIIAVLNGARTLERCLASIASQTYKNVELIVKDGGSTDGTLDIINKYKDVICFYESSRDTGVYDAWNRVLPRATGDWIYFLGSDDYLYSPTVMADVATVLAKAAGRHLIVYGQVLVTDADGLVRYGTIGEPWEHIKHRLRFSNPIPHQGVFHNRMLFKVHGLFDPTFRIAGDYEFLLRELKTSDPLFIPGTVIAVHATGGMSDLAYNGLLRLIEQRRAQCLHGYGALHPGWIWALAKASLKSLLAHAVGEQATKRLVHQYRRHKAAGIGVTVRRGGR